MNTSFSSFLPTSFASLVGAALLLAGGALGVACSKSSPSTTPDVSAEAQTTTPRPIAGRRETASPERAPVLRGGVAPQGPEDPSTGAAGPAVDTTAPDTDLPADAPSVTLREGFGTTTYFVDERWVYEASAAAPLPVSGRRTALREVASEPHLRIWRTDAPADARDAVADASAGTAGGRLYYGVRQALSGRAPLRFHAGRVLLVLKPSEDVAALASRYGFTVVRPMPMGPNAHLVEAAGGGLAPLDLAKTLQGLDGVVSAEVDWMVGGLVRPQ